MPWTAAVISPNTELADIVGITVTFTDATEFELPWTYQDPRVNVASGGQAIGQFRSRANAALNAERARRVALANRESQLLTFMNNG